MLCGACDIFHICKLVLLLGPLKLTTTEKVVFVISFLIGTHQLQNRLTVKAMQMHTLQSIKSSGIELKHIHLP